MKQGHKNQSISTPARSTALKFHELKRILLNSIARFDRNTRNQTGEIFQSTGKKKSPPEELNRARLIRSETQTTDHSGNEVCSCESEHRLAWKSKDMPTTKNRRGDEACLPNRGLQRPRRRIYAATFSSGQ